MENFPDHRVKVLNNMPVNDNGDFVLYWMTSYRRVRWNFSLDRSIMWAKRLDKPLVILEALRCAHRYACDRFHNFVMDGMKDNLLAVQNSEIAYYPYIEPDPDAGKGLLREFSFKACVVVTDFFPCFFLPGMTLAGALQVFCRMEQVDSNGLFPCRESDQVFVSAFSFRRYLQKNLPKYIMEAPEEDPLTPSELRGLKKFPDNIIQKWPRASEFLLLSEHRDLTKLPIDHEIGPTAIKGGSSQASATLGTFLNQRLSRYAEERNDVDHPATSGLSPYLHWGHISAHEIFWTLMRSENWTPDSLSGKSNGKRTGWWGTGKNAEAFLDELVTWREIGFNMCRLTSNFDSYDSLPDWSRKTLADHQSDLKEFYYEIDEFENATTHDNIWNAAQKELVRTGKIHNYLRMLWGKKILEWSVTPKRSMEIMIELNNKYALDGRDPNSYSGIFWILGRYDRPWGPERSIFGKIRYMSSERTRGKIDLKNYLTIYR